MSEAIWYFIFGLPLIILAYGAYHYWRVEEEKSRMWSLLFTIGMMIVFVIFALLFPGAICITRLGAC